MTSRALQLLGAATGRRQPPEFSEFGRFAGSWHVDAEFFESDGSSERVTAEWHFAPVLGGQVLQDVLVFPRGVDMAGARRVGTSLRFYDEEASMWRVVWINAETGTMYKLSGGLEGDRIVLHGDPHDGEPTQWIFETITDDSFIWRGMVDEGDGWRLLQLMRATRVDW